ncbi:hypothetical protein AV656_12130 [Bhargavaea cecembensis]|uniref:Uncharacterized protein n=1 Tax=Bhargavaea cecembensis TaxID=394098 RepID=A0A161SQ25_9BACL|nr:hypothetical protein [Bhargavaea cecembensis]KZE37310.1 hypothetical protein AV656_12130 [Bhargavaea cecembensis]
MTDVFKKILAESSGHSVIKRMHLFLMLHLNNGTAFSVSAEDDSGELFNTHLFRFEHHIPHRRCVTLIPVHPLTHIASPKSSVTVDLHSFCGFQWVDPKRLTKIPDHRSDPAQGHLSVRKDDPIDVSNVLSKHPKVSRSTTVIPFDKIKKITIRPNKGK